MKTHFLPDHELIDAYRMAMLVYETAKTGIGCRVEAFISLLVAERLLTSRFGLVDLNIERFRERYSP